VKDTKRVAHFATVLTKMGKGLIFAAFICVFIVIIQSFFRGINFSTMLEIIAGLVVIAVPIALPAVITTTLAVGATVLAKKHAIVHELGAIERLAAVDILCTDKVCRNYFIFTSTFCRLIKQNILIFNHKGYRQELLL
jgi:H+-transporting ATPase